MTIYEYVAQKNPIGAKNVLNSFGHKAVPRPDILARQLANSVNQYGKEALYRIAAIHPDLELIEHYLDHSESKEAKSKTVEAEKSLFSSAEGQEIKRAVEDIKNNQNSKNNAPKEKSEKTELLIIGAVVLVALALVLKKP